VMKKKMQFLIALDEFLKIDDETYMMPKAQEALSMAHCRSTFSP
jgi:hypothetical protein